MIRIDNAIVSLDIVEKHFACNPAVCKGNCCVYGDSGAPLEEDEKRLLEEELRNIRPFLSENGRRTIDQTGVCVVDADGDTVTPLVDNRECAYTVFEEGTARCGIEKAYFAGKTAFRKPISCHIYPIRIKDYHDYQALNYDEWEICRSAREKGREEAIPVYRFVREALERKFGRKWYLRFDKMARNWIKQKENKHP